MKQSAIKNRVDVVTLGCSKNLVDSALRMRQLISNGYTLEHDSNNPRGEIAIINTCGFIGDAKEDSVNTILSFAEAKAGVLFLSTQLTKRSFRIFTGRIFPKPKPIMPFRIP